MIFATAAVMAISFPVPDGLLDLLRDFTIAVVRNKPDDLEKYAAQYFTELSAAMDGAAEAGSVECSKTRSFVEFDESMYANAGGSGQVLDDDVVSGSQKGSQRSVAESQRTHESAISSAKSGEKPPEEKCPDEAAACWEKWMQEEKAAAAAELDSAAAAEESADNVSGEFVAGEGGAERDSALVQEPAIDDGLRQSVGAAVEESTTRQSTTV